MRGLLAPVIGAASLMFLALVSAASAQTVYQWTDEKGVIHFSNSAPPKGVDFQRREMPVAPPLASLPADTGAPAGAPDAGNAPGPKNDGMARLVLEHNESVRDGPNGQTFTGDVKNVGSAPARDVAVQITVTDPVQGDECLRDEIAVRPSTLGPGQSAEYHGSFENPCFYGDAKVDLSPVWNQ